MCQFEYVQFYMLIVWMQYLKNVLLLQERPLSKSLQKGEDPQFDQVGIIETCMS